MECVHERWRRGRTAKGQQTTPRHDPPRAAGDGGGHPAPRLGLAALVALALIWGYNWAVMKIGLRYSQPFTFAALRTFLGALSLLVLLPVMRRPWRPPTIGLTAAVGLLQATGFAGLISWALQSGGAGKTSVLAYTMPFWLLLLARAFLGERLRRSQWLAVGLAFAGLVLALEPWRLHGVASSLMAVGAGLSWAASAVLVKVLQRRHTVDLLSFTAWQMLFGSIPLVVIALLTYTGPPLWTASFSAALVYNIVLGTALAWLLWLYILRTLPAGSAGMSTLAIPVIGVISAWLQLGERPGGAEALGMALIVAALCLLALLGARQHGPDDAAPALYSGQAGKEGESGPVRDDRDALQRARIQT